MKGLKQEFQEEMKLKDCDSKVEEDVQDNKAIKVPEKIEEKIPKIKENIKKIENIQLKISDFGITK